jgi:hypothetical protein
MRGVIYGSWVHLCFVVLRKMGFFPSHQGTLMVVLDSSSRASAVVSVRNPQRLTLTDGTVGDSPRGPLKQRGNPHLNPGIKTR